MGLRKWAPTRLADEQLQLSEKKLNLNIPSQINVLRSLQKCIYHCYTKRTIMATMTDGNCMENVIAFALRATSVLQ